MKDIQGYERGKCNNCECKEYRVPPGEPLSDKPRRLRCEYCNHTPVEHVWIIELGECTKCGADNCDKYESEEKNSYTDCGYCGCSASNHKGAEKLRMNTPIAPRVDASGNPVQLSHHGPCKRQGCPYSRRMDQNGTLYDYCSKTCADASSSHRTTAASRSANSQESPVTSSAITGGSTAQGSGQPVSSGQDSSPLMLCSVCNRNLATPGHSWCSSCYSIYQAQNKQQK